MSNSISENMEVFDEKLGIDELLFAEENLNSLTIPLSANGWVTKQSDDATEVITDSGLANWIRQESIASVFFHSCKSGEIHLSIRCKVPDGKSRLKLSIDKFSLKIDVEGNQYKVFKVGKFLIKHSGYVKVDFQGVNKTHNYYADVSHLIISGHIVDDQSICYIREEPHEDIYWSRRGPSVHLDYKLPIDIESEYYYNEVTIPNGYDPIGSFFMAIGFEFGYYGIQVNSESERRVLFSVWSPQETDDPKDITDENRVELVNKGEDVMAGEFGCEGCGGQSFLRYMWRTGITYQFLLKGNPDPHDSTHSIYTAWFAELNKNWTLIASFKRPKTHKYLSRFHSFVESFEPNTGYLTRKALFGNQWIYDISGEWHEVTNTRFTGDATAINKVRLDFEIGIQRQTQNREQFYLQNCGFFEGKVALFTDIKRTENKVHPSINFNELSF